MQDFVNIAMANPVVLEYLPAQKEMMALPREYLITVLHSILGENFKLWVDQQITQRDQSSKINNNENISMDPEIAKIFMEATHSTCKSYSK